MSFNEGFDLFCRVVIFVQSMDQEYELAQISSQILLLPAWYFLLNIEDRFIYVLRDDCIN